MLLKTLVFCDVMPCRLLNSDFLNNLIVLIPGSRYCFALNKEASRSVETSVLIYTFFS